MLPSLRDTSVGSLPLRRRMDDEEEDMSRPISQLWGTPFRDVKYEDRATQIAAGQAIAVVPTSQSHNNNSIGINTLPCGLYRQPRIPFHGNAGLRSHFPAQFEPMEDRGEIQIEEEEEEGRGEEDDRMAEGPEEQAGVSVEVQIGRKLREIGDKFQQDHVELLMRHQRQNLPAWMRLTMALFGFLFPREALFPRLRGEQR
ncbi:BCL2 modifying factor 2 isoform X1 [Chelmon rostratus]|uniref:BCL2 modifying factor 2 isoform X1 n=2 Tax=Chelmon rostratus TaxID=109905 RepID=UPI001BE87597|nr:BCL2 modifying factor 2 isoform X1 [Chelmon rostratus]